jgi:hypothetical protein
VAPAASPETLAPAASPASPAVKVSFEELARRISRREPRRGSVLQPPPAWEPDEVTLAFAMTRDENGSFRELPEPIVLATILVAVETERRRLVRLLTGGGNEEINAIANLYWPLLILPGRVEPEVAIFDGTGVWKRAFRYTLLPPMEQVRSLFDRPLASSDLLAQLRALLPYFAYDPGAELLTVEGFLPVDPPLLFDVLSHSEFRSDPQVPHAGFLPARHEVNWYRETVEQMQRWLDRFESDLSFLTEVRSRTETLVQQHVSRLEVEYREAEAQWRSRIKEATQKAEAEIAELQKRRQDEIRQHLEVIRKGQATIAHSEAAASTADALTTRANHRRVDAGAHVARGKQAEAMIRESQRQIAESRKSIERVHAQERSDVEQAIAGVERLERECARALADRELFRDELVVAGQDVLQAVDGQLAARASQKNLLAGYFLPLPSLARIRVVWFPLWTAVLRGPHGIRQLVFPPMQVRPAKGLSGTLRSLFGGVVLPLEPRTAQFDKVLRTTMEESLQKDPWLATAAQELCRAADVLADPDVIQRFQEGLRELRRAGWLSGKHEEDFLRAFIERAQRRGQAPAGVPVSPPPGATADTHPVAAPP